MTIVASLIFLFAMTLCSLIIISTLSSSAHRVLDVILDRDHNSPPPKIRVGEIKHSQNRIVKKSAQNNLVAMPLILSKRQEILSDNWSEAA